LYFYEYNGSSSASSTSIEEKSASPTPTMMIESGRDEPLTISSMVYFISLMIPSVMISKI